jgi:hypothetical protein
MVFSGPERNKYTRGNGRIGRSVGRSAATMPDMKRAWVRFRDLPDDLLDGMPEHMRSTFLAARRYCFEVEMLCAGAKAPAHLRAPRRLVLVADDLGREDSGGPLSFDLEALTRDVRAAPRLFVISTSLNVGIYGDRCESCS